MTTRDYIGQNMTKAAYQITSNKNVVNVKLEGVFVLDDVKRYEKALQKHVFENHFEQWLLVADVNGLEPSPMDAIKYTENITNWVLANRCQGIINIHDLNETIVDFQLAIAAGGNKIYNAKTPEQALHLAAELGKARDIAV